MPITTDPTPQRNREQRRHPLKAAYNPDTLAAEIGVSRSYIYSAIAAGRLASKKAGRRRLILGYDAAEWLEALPA